MPSATTLSPSEPASATTARTTAALALPWLAVGLVRGATKLRSILSVSSGKRCRYPSDE